MYVILFINGWFQGMGWPPSGRVMVHWFSLRERGTKMGIWNVAHNVGGGLIGPLAIVGLAIFSDWRSVFYFPAIIASIIALVAFYLISDTPQSVGLPPIEAYKNDYPPVIPENPEKELTSKEIFLKYILPNKYLWYIALANIFIYIIRYGVIDWAPTYLSETKGFSTSESSWAYFAYEYAGIPGTLLCGYLSDKVFKGNRALISIIYLLLVIVALMVYWLTPAGYFWVDNIALLSIGFLIYGPVMLIGVQALDMVHKKAAGTAAGLTGMFGYLGGALTANIAIGYLVDFYGWDGGFYLLIAAGVLAILFTAMTLKQSAQ
jgi:OPA family glycerol-3-phosphate transporter-like MFS transporter